MFIEVILICFSFLCIAVCPFWDIGKDDDGFPRVKGQRRANMRKLARKYEEDDKLVDLQNK